MIQNFIKIAQRTDGLPVGLLHCLRSDAFRFLVFVDDDVIMTEA